MTFSKLGMKNWSCDKS